MLMKQRQSLIFNPNFQDKNIQKYQQNSITTQIAQLAKSRDLIQQKIQQNILQDQNNHSRYRKGLNVYQFEGSTRDDFVPFLNERSSLGHLLNNSMTSKHNQSSIMQAQQTNSQNSINSNMILFNSDANFKQYKSKQKVRQAGEKLMQSLRRKMRNFSQDQIELQQPNANKHENGEYEPLQATQQYIQQTSKQQIEVQKRNKHKQILGRILQKQKNQKQTTTTVPSNEQKTPKKQQQQQMTCSSEIKQCSDEKQSHAFTKQIDYSQASLIDVIKQTKFYVAPQQKGQTLSSLTNAEYFVHNDQINRYKKSYYLFKKSQQNHANNYSFNLNLNDTKILNSSLSEQQQQIQQEQEQEQEQQKISLNNNGNINLIDDPYFNLKLNQSQQQDSNSHLNQSFTYQEMHKQIHFAEGKKHTINRNNRLRLLNPLEVYNKPPPLGFYEVHRQLIERKSPTAFQPRVQRFLNPIKLDHIDYQNQSFNLQSKQLNSTIENTIQKGLDLQIENSNKTQQKQIDMVKGGCNVLNDIIRNPNVNMSKLNKECQQVTKEQKNNTKQFLDSFISEEKTNPYLHDIMKQMNLYLGFSVSLIKNFKEFPPDFQQKILQLKEKFQMLKRNMDRFGIKERYDQYKQFKKENK